MSSTDTWQTDLSRDDTNNDGPASQHSSAVVQAINIGQNLSEGLENNQVQQNEQQNSGKNTQADTGADGQGDHSSAQAVPIVLSKLALHPPQWPAAGFANDDPAIAHMVAIMQSLEARPPSPSPAEDIILLPTIDPKKREQKLFEQLLRRRVTDGGNYNFFLPFAEFPGDMIGKVDFSKTGLAIMTEALRAVVRGYGETTSIAPLSQHVDRLNAANGVMDFVKPRKDDGVHFAFVRPFTPEGVRTVSAALQAALRHPASKYAIFYAHAVAGPSLRRRMGACFEVYPIIGWSN